MILAIDPGIDTGWAVFNNTGFTSPTNLLDCGLGDPRKIDWAVEYGHMTRVIIEKPQVYRAAQSKGDPNDLITLAIRVGWYQEYFQSRGVKVDLFTPAVWKGQVPKAVHHRRIWNKLTTEEKVQVSMDLVGVTQTKKHNVMDAVGLGLFALGRTRVGVT